MDAVFHHRGRHVPPTAPRQVTVQGIQIGLVDVHIHHPQPMRTGILGKSIHRGAEEGSRGDAHRPIRPEEDGEDDERNEDHREEHEPDSAGATSAPFHRLRPALMSRTSMISTVSNTKLRLKPRPSKADKSITGIHKP